MLNWAWQDIKEAVAYFFENRIKDLVVKLWYKINCLEIDVYKKSMLLYKTHNDMSPSDFFTQTRKFRINENELCSQIVSLYKNGSLSVV